MKAYAYVQQPPPPLEVGDRVALTRCRAWVAGGLARIEDIRTAAEHVAGRHRRTHAKYLLRFADNSTRWVSGGQVEYRPNQAELAVRTGVVRATALLERINEKNARFEDDRMAFDED